MSGIEVRAARADDERAWRELWDGYCAFYEVSVAGAVTTRTWERLLDPDEPMEALVAEQDGVVVGFVNCVIHRTTWGAGMTCYLEDLFVSPEARGAGAGRALIETVIERARERRWDKVYWHTRADNARARALYDSLAQVDDFVRYVVPPE
jgi:ribosomal protein S18 acetylase RimI-like enzyme